MMCQRIGLPPISTIGFGRMWDSSLILVPRPPASMTTFINALLKLVNRRGRRSSGSVVRGLQTWLVAHYHARSSAFKSVSPQGGRRQPLLYRLRALPPGKTTDVVNLSRKTTISPCVRKERVIALL